MRVCRAKFYSFLGNQSHKSMYIPNGQQCIQFRKSPKRLKSFHPTGYLQYTVLSVLFIVVSHYPANMSLSWHSFPTVSYTFSISQIPINEIVPNIENMSTLNSWYEYTAKNIYPYRMDSTPVVLKGQCHENFTRFNLGPIWTSKNGFVQFFNTEIFNQKVWTFGVGVVNNYADTRFVLYCTLYSVQ